MKNDKKKQVATILGLVFLFVMIIGITYEVFNYAGKGSKENSITTGTVKFVYNEASNGISISNAFPLSDTEVKILTDEGDGITKGYFDFNIQSTMGSSITIPYYIYAVDITNSTSNKLCKSIFNRCRKYGDSRMENNRSIQ